ncbi:MAG: glutamine amidotransferase [Streptosporangiales bacterium]|nr:glutamine amidotransferase [Streptosporangiales bacterium]
MTMTPRPVYLYVFDELPDWETGHATAHINAPMWQREPGRYGVRTVGATTDPVTTMGGTRIVPDMTLDQVTADEAAMLILPGGFSYEAESTPHDAVMAKVAELMAAGTPVAAICGAIFGLARAGLLDEVDHTGAAKEYLAMTGYVGGEHYRDELAVTDRGVITAGPTEPVAFARHIFAALDLYEPEILDAWYGLYSTGDPAYFGVLDAAS